MWSKKCEEQETCLYGSYICPGSTGGMSAPPRAWRIKHPIKHQVLGAPSERGERVGLGIILVDQLTRADFFRELVLAVH